MQLVDNKFIWVLHFNAVGLQNCLREVFDVQGGDRISVADYRCGHDVAVIGVWQVDAARQR